MWYSKPEIEIQKQDKNNRRVFLQNVAGLADQTVIAQPSYQIVQIAGSRLTCFHPVSDQSTIIIVSIQVIVSRVVFPWTGIIQIVL